MPATTSTARRPRDLLAWGALLAALVGTASAEYALAVAVGFGPWTAACVPAALDLYAVRAMRAGRDVAAAVAAMVATNSLSHLVAVGLLPVGWPLVVAVSAIAPLVLWRVHRLAAHLDDGQAVNAEQTAVQAPVNVERAERVHRPRPAPSAVPDGARLLPIVAAEKRAEQAAVNAPAEAVEQGERPALAAVNTGAGRVHARRAAAAEAARAAVTVNVEQAPVNGSKMGERAAREHVAAGVAAGRSRRALAAETGWSLGWVSARAREAEAARQAVEQVPLVEGAGA